MMQGTFNWNELNTRDIEKAKKFYGETMGWSYDTMPGGMEGEYTLIKNGEDVIGGMLDISGPMFEGTPECWFTYIAVDDMDDRLELARKNGAQVLREPWEVPEVGKIAIVADAGGAVAGWIKPAQ